MSPKQDRSEAFAETFKSLRSILATYAPHLILVTDSPDRYYLDTAHIMKNKKPLFFGAVFIKKAYVSYHLFPVYMYPVLLNGVSPDLKKRMQGKSCFNFKTVEPGLLAELETLTRAGFEKLKSEGYLGG